MSIDSSVNITNRLGGPGAALFIFEAVPVVGAVASVPGILISLALTVARVCQAAFHAIKAQLNKQQQEHHEQLKAQLMQDASFWGLVFLNQVANLCTLGILNNIVIRIALKNAVQDMGNSLEESQNMPNSQAL